ncbi:MAG: hypothetical protein CMP84_08620 [Gammaproteobacteria bacterium]|nr:hypothetical protein [Gammaproteobacteria bacterium]
MVHISSAHIEADFPHVEERQYGTELIVLMKRLIWCLKQGFPPGRWFHEPVNHNSPRLASLTIAIGKALLKANQPTSVILQFTKQTK